MKEIVTKDKLDILDEKLTVRKEVIPIEQIINLAEKGNTFADIGKILGCSKQAISERLKKFNYTPARLKAWKKSKADVLALLQSNIVQSIDEDAIKKANLQQKMWAFGVAFDKERLERGQSTANISMFEHIVAGTHKEPATYV